jgi:NADPH:quinone reductase-like Zn-dependent oxidoreductase
VLHAGDGGAPVPAELRLETITYSALADDEVLVEPLYGSWEANMAHAIERRPIDVCIARKEPKVVVGNAGVVRVLEVGEAVTGLEPGDTCMFFSTGVPDALGYMLLAHAYDAPGTIGLLAKRTKVPARNLFPLPDGTPYTLQQWAAFSLRYMTAWSNWNVAYTCFRSQIPEEDVPSPDVWGWGGGCTLAELELAQARGCRATMLSGTPEHLEHIRSRGVAAIDRRDFPDLSFDPARYSDDEAYRAAYQASEHKFLAQVDELTDGRGVSIFVDYIGGPVTRVTQKALGRMGVITTAGWKHGMSTPMNRAMECIARHLYVHTHYARFSDVEPAIAFAESTGWMPHVAPDDCYSWDEVPKLVSDYEEGHTGYFPVYAVNA